MRVRWYQPPVDDRGMYPNPVLLCDRHRKPKHTLMTGFLVPNNVVCDVCRQKIKEFCIRTCEVDIPIQRLIGDVFHMEDGGTLTIYEADGEVDIADEIHFANEYHFIDEDDIPELVEMVSWLFEGIEKKYLRDMEMTKASARMRFREMLVPYEKVRFCGDFLSIDEWMDTRCDLHCDECARLAWKEWMNRK